MRDIVVLALAYCVAMRVFEVCWSKRNARRVLARGGETIVPDGMAAIALVHGLWFLAMALEDTLLGPHARLLRYRFMFFGAFAGAEVLRFWCVASLGDSWNVRVLVCPGVAPVRHGPYRYLRHPNYLGALVMLVSLPLALGLPYTAAAVLPAKLLALRQRIRIEDAALG